MIRFPRMHIAESTANRILNLVDEMRGSGVMEPPAIPTPPPELPAAPAMQGAQLDNALATPPPADLEAPPAMLAPGGGL